MKIVCEEPRSQRRGRLLQTWKGRAGFLGRWTGFKMSVEGYDERNSKTISSKEEDGKVRANFHMSEGKLKACVGFLKIDVQRIS